MYRPLLDHGRGDPFIPATSIIAGMTAAVDALATDDGNPVAVVTLEARDAARVRHLEPVLALFAERLGSALGRLRASQHQEFLRRYLQEMFGIRCAITVLAGRASPAAVLSSR